MTIRIFVTGGTIDKDYDKLKQVMVLTKTHIRKILKDGNNLEKTKVSELMLKDSLHMTEADRKKILKVCKSSKEKRIIITHGTDNMDVTAKLLGKNIKNKTLVLTGAMWPESMEDDDSSFNVGGGIIAAQSLKKGVYIVMNGKIFNWNNVRKNMKKGNFEKIR